MVGIEENTCPKCDSSTFFKECWKCGGEGGTGGEELMSEDPLWYGPDDFRPCDICDGNGGWQMCYNEKCNE